MSFTLVSSKAIIAKAGINHNTGYTTVGASLALIADLAESRFCALTRKDWITDFSSVGTNYRGAIEDCVSDIAGTIIITADMSGYTSRVEAQTMLDVLRDKINQAIDFFKEDRNRELVA